jgi:hypothetical protein
MAMEEDLGRGGRVHWVEWLLVWSPSLELMSFVFFCSALKVMFRWGT